MFCQTTKHLHSHCVLHVDAGVTWTTGKIVKLGLHSKFTHPSRKSPRWMESQTHWKTHVHTLHIHLRVRALVVANFLYIYIFIHIYCCSRCAKFRIPKITAALCYYYDWRVCSHQETCSVYHASAPGFDRQTQASTATTATTDAKRPKTYTNNTSILYGNVVLYALSMIYAFNVAA